MGNNTSSSGERLNEDALKDIQMKLPSFLTGKEIEEWYRMFLDECGESGEISRDKFTMSESQKIKEFMDFTFSAIVMNYLEAEKGGSSTGGFGKADLNKDVNENVNSQKNEIEVVKNKKNLKFQHVAPTLSVYDKGTLDRKLNWGFTTLSKGEDCIDVKNLKELLDITYQTLPEKYIKELPENMKSTEDCVNLLSHKIQKLKENTKENKNKDSKEKSKEMYKMEKLSKIDYLHLCSNDS